MKYNKPLVFSIVFFLVLLVILVLVNRCGPYMEGFIGSETPEKGYQSTFEFSDEDDKRITLQMDAQQGVPRVAFPFKNVVDENGQLVNIIMISAPFRTEEDEKMYEKLRLAGLEFCGLSSYLDFPGKIWNPFDSFFHEERKHDYTKMVKAWVHCFKTPPSNLSYSQLPLLMMSEADLKDPESIQYTGNDEKQYDFIYSCLREDENDDSCKPGWNWYNRNWDVAKRCLVIMCKQYGLRGVIVGRQNCEMTDFCKNLIEVQPFLPWHEFQAKMRQCRFLFAPNTSDASPRVITEAMCWNMPVLVNENILGGWNNVIPGITGEFFTTENDLPKALDKLTKQYDDYRPREWFIENRGKNNCGPELAEFLKSSFPKINKPEAKLITMG